MAKRYKTIISWNVNGVRAAVRKGLLTWLERTRPDILCIQETKAQTHQLAEEILHPNGYFGVWNSAEKKGYSGTATFLLEKPQAAITHFGEDLLDEEGRIVLTEHSNFWLFNTYFPNGGRGTERLNYKLSFYDRFLKLMESYRRSGKPVIVCGDVNTAHHPIDLARPKENERTSGFMPIERKWLDVLEKKGYVDTFRFAHPEEEGRYSWWDMKSAARERNVGWRIDYFWAHRTILSKVKDAFIQEDIMGSDHAPVGITLDVKSL